MTTKTVDARLMYFVGLFEGDGSACIGKSKSRVCGTGYEYQAHLSVQMTDYEPVKACCDYFGGSVYLDKERRDTNQRDSYRWVIRGKKVSDIAKQLSPHILTPRKQGALQCVIDFAETIGKIGRPLPLEIRQRRDDLYHKCCAYNAKGIGANNRSEEALVAIEAYETDTAQMNLWA